MGVLLSLAAALAYGVSDFIGGIAARRTSAWPVALASGIGALVGAVVLALAFPGDPAPAHLAWGCWPGSAAAPAPPSSTAASRPGGWAWWRRSRPSAPRCSRS
ncbi:hypothetical protein [Nocardioides sambongensis]|uniref:hypothetical protein n=1 Tax=Nocardioides sambongensis TaxID=2589074 RepID=UPI0018C8A790|nr:hypothetical protein [Nocardioides sambongensis]